MLNEFLSYSFHKHNFIITFTKCSLITQGNCKTKIIIDLAVFLTMN